MHIVARSAVQSKRERAHGYHCFLKQKRPHPCGLVSWRLLAEGTEEAPAAHADVINLIDIVLVNWTSKINVGKEENNVATSKFQKLRNY